MNCRSSLLPSYLPWFIFALRYCCFFFLTQIVAWEPKVIKYRRNISASPNGCAWVTIATPDAWMRDFKMKYNWTFYTTNQLNYVAHRNYILKSSDLELKWPQRLSTPPRRFSALPGGPIKGAARSREVFRGMLPTAPKPPKWVRILFSQESGFWIYLFKTGYKAFLLPIWHWPWSYYEICGRVRYIASF